MAERPVVGQPVPAVLEQHLRAPAAQDLHGARAADAGRRERDDLEDRVVERRRVARHDGRCAAGAGPRRGAAPARAAPGRSRGRRRRSTGQSAPAPARRRSGAGSPRAGSAEPSTQAQTARYWRQRARVPSCAAERQSASARPSHTPLMRPSTRSGADGLGWMTPARARCPTIARTTSSSQPAAGELLDGTSNLAPASATARRRRRRAPVSARATAFSAGSSTVERSMKNTCRPLSRADANSRQRAGAPSRPGAAGLLVVGLERAGHRSWQTVRTSALSTPMPNAFVATTTSTSPAMKRRCASARASRGRPAW